MHRLVTIPVLIVLLALNPTLAAADLFDDAVDALTNQNMQAASLDNVGQALRGGLAAGYPQYVPGPTPLHGFEISTPCGSFSLGTGFMDQLTGMLDPSAIISEIQSSATSLIGAAVSQLPMVGLCYAAPTMCDVVKNLQNFVKDMVQFKGLSCQQAESMLTGLGGKIRKQVESKCVQRKTAGGMTVQKAEEACAGSAGEMRQGIIDHASGKPITDGGSDGDSKLVEDTLRRAGASQELIDFSAEYVGEIEITGDADAGIDVDIQAPEKRLHDEYERMKQQVHNDLYESVNIVASGNQLPPDKRKTISLPGMAMPDGVLLGIHEIGEEDPAAGGDYMGKLASNIALLKLEWKVNETADHLEHGTINNANLDEASQEMLDLQLVRLNRAKQRFIREKETAERHLLPVMREVMAHRQEVRDRATNAALAAADDPSVAGKRFGAQNALGYGY